MERRRGWFIVAAAVVLLASGVWVANAYFLPEGTTRLDEDTADLGIGSGDPPQVVSEGAWRGKDGHSASGTVQVLLIDGEHFLRFVDFEMTSGPDVYLYLTRSQDGDSKADIQDGVKIRIDGGLDGGELTKRGTFHQRVPDDVDVSAYAGVAAWCDRFAVPFGTAPLASPA